VGRLRYAVIALLLVIFAGVAVVFAGGTDPSAIDDRSAEQVLDQEPGPPAPPLDGAGGGWINSEALIDADVEGQVVVYDFWTYSCVNCIRTLPYLRAGTPTTGW
jgi:thiol-disulfide isomerase/thioredoxin